MIILKGDIKDKLNRKISIPSEVHGYSLAVDFIQRWFYEKFNRLVTSHDGRDFFKTRYINGKNVFDDFRIFNIQDKDTYIKRPKPIVIITPEPDFHTDRRGLKQFANMMGPDIMINRINHDNYFFMDSERKIKIVLSMNSLEVKFNFKIKVDSRAKQMDLLRYMQLNFREGDTMGYYLDLDFHIPEDIIFALAYHSGFVDENNDVINNMDFLAYMNRHSKLPITYKLRTINGKSEYFVRVPNQYIHVNNTERIEYDNGERVGMLDNNFTIDMNTILTIPIPYLYAYYTTQEVDINIPTVEFADLGLYTFKIVDIPDHNEKGWEKFASSEIMCDKILEKDEKESINISSIFSKELLKYIEDCKSCYLSPSIFIDFKLFDNNGDAHEYNIDWNTYTLDIIGPICDDRKCILVVYLDNNYINSNIITKNKLNESRLS